MTNFMSVNEQLMKDLESKNLENKIEAIQYIKEEKYILFVPKLLKMLSTEENINILNDLALCLGKFKINEAVPILMGYIKNPEFQNIRGSFIYALLDLDCEEYFLDFVKMICDGDFEVYDHSFLVFESIIDDAKYDQKIEALKILQNQKEIEMLKSKSEYPQFDRINYINDALEILKTSL